MREFFDFAFQVFQQERLWDGKECIKRMRNNGGRNWRQMEWPGWYAEFLLDSCQDHMLYQRNDRKNRNTIFDYKIKTRKDTYLDLKTHSADKDSTIYLNDYQATIDAINTSDLFFLVLSGYPKYDNWEDFVAYQYMLDGKAWQKKENSRRRKSGFLLSSLSLYRLSYDDIKQKTQGKNSNGKPRPTKASVNLKTVAPIYQEVFCDSK